jgi:hypothetical protein
LWISVKENAKDEVIGLLKRGLENSEPIGNYFEGEKMVEVKK